MGDTPHLASQTSEGHASVSVVKQKSRVRAVNTRFGLIDNCSICHGAGFTIANVPVGHPDFGKAIPCQCRKQDRVHHRMRRLQAMSSLDSLHQMTFATFDPDLEHLSQEKRSNLRSAFEACLAFAEQPENWLVLSGTYGCGKTHLAAAIAHARMEMGEPVLFVVAPDLLDHLRSTYGPESEVTYDELFEQVRTAPLLILDDLGAQSNTAWAQEKLFQLLNHRYNDQLPTVVTTNQRIDDMDPRLRSRLLDIRRVTFYPILAPDYRADREPSQSELSTLHFHREQTFQSFDARRTDVSSEERMNLQEVMNGCRKYAEHPHGWLVLAGTYGCGKTHLAAAIANYQSDELHNDVRFVVVPDLLDYLRAAYSPQSTTSYDRRFDEVRRTHLLVLDDLGTESATPWAREKLFQLLNYRYSAALPTIITTSSTLDKIDPWLRNRMSDINRCQFWAIIAPGYRGSRSQQQQLKKDGVPKVRATK